MRVDVVPDARALAEAAVEAWREAAARAVAERGRFVVAISGGRTPVPAYEALERAPALPWAATDVLFADERCVPPDHPDSNYGQAARVLLSRVPAHAHRVMSEEEPAAAAEAYDALLGALGPLDLALLGIGADGHTASLFPGCPALEERERLAVAVRAPGGAPGPCRVTLTPAALGAARELLFLVSGAEKRDALARVLAGEPLPAARVAGGRARFLVTADARP